MKSRLPSLMIALAILLPGCAGDSSRQGRSTTEARSTPESTKTLYIIAIDRSKSTEAIRKQLLLSTFDMAMAFDPKANSMVLYRFGHTVEQFYGKLPQDEDAFFEVLKSNVEVSDPVPGTDYPKLLETLADFAESAGYDDIRIVIVGDGENDYAGNKTFAERYKAAGDRLGRNPRVKMLRFWGVTTGYREEIQRMCGALGPRLSIQSMDQNYLAPL